MDEDLDTPPASDDPVVQQYLDMNWREAMQAARSGMACMRRVWPELVQHIPETGARQLKSALDSFEQATAHLHASGRHVLGEEIYDAYLTAQTQRQIEL